MQIQSPEVFSSVELPKQQQQQQRQAIELIEAKIFTHAGLLNKYQKNQILVSESEYIATYFIRSPKETATTFYISHGFGGSSLMFFPFFNYFLEKGNIVLWEVRGMGVAIKPNYPSIPDRLINDFYVLGLKKVIDFYSHPSIVFVCHSLSAHIVLQFLIKYPINQAITKSILLSPVGITRKQRDQRNKIKNCSDFMSLIGNKISWKFSITFKTPMRNILKCFRRKILKGAFAQFNFNDDQLMLMVDLFQALVDLKDGSQSIFFRYFLPRVLPRPTQSIEQLISKECIGHPIRIFYGGKQDWVDKKGAQDLCQKYAKVNIEILRNCGHMICLNKPQMKYIIEKQLN